MLKAAYKLTENKHWVNLHIYNPIQQLKQLGNVFKLFSQENQQRQFSDPKWHICFFSYQHWEQKSKSDDIAIGSK